MGWKGGDLGFSLPRGFFKDLGNFLAKWGNDVFTLQRGCF